MKLTSSAFSDGQILPVASTCDGQGVSPPLAISDVPSAAQSLALIVEDPDAPGGIFVHWVAWNIAPTIRELAQGQVPQGAVEGATSTGKSGYVGACPPTGSHRYLFRLFALDTSLDLSSSTDRAALQQAMQGHILAETLLTGHYLRAK